MAAAPALTHHEILALVEPFTRRGFHVDLAASDRSARRLVFKTVDVPATSGGATVLRETLTMDCSDADRCVVQRTLTDPSGLQATLDAEGTQPDAALAAIAAIPREQHFRSGDGYVIARSYGFWPPKNATRGEPAVASLFLTRAMVRIDGLVLTLALALPRLRNVAADLTLEPTGGARFDLPEDLLAVLGWDWARLVATDASWTSKLRLRGNVLRRSRTAERELERAARHLVAKFAEPPARFHDRHRLARWGVVLRRGIPSIASVLLIVGALKLPAFSDHEYAGIFMALHYVPIAILALAFSLQELPRFEIPPLPRRSRAQRWRAPAERHGG